MFVVLDGPDGAGKSGIIAKVLGVLNQQGHNKVILTREPGGTVIGAKIRNILLNHTLTKKAQFYLFCADREEHQQTIKEYLKEGYIVLCDRYVYSTQVYQKGCNGISEKLYDVATQNLLEPDLYFLITSNIPHGLKGDTMDIEFIDRREEIKKRYKEETPYDHLVDTSEGDWSNYVSKIASKIQRRLCE